jgi:hypothetical protein
LLADDIAISLTIDEDGPQGPRYASRTETPPDIVIPIMESVTLRNVNVRILDKDMSRPVRILLRYFNIDDIRDTGPLFVKGEGAVSGKDFQIEGRLGPLADVLTHARPYPVELNLGVVDLDLKVSGAVDDPIQGEGLDLHVVAEVAELANTLNLLHLDVPRLGRLKLEAAITGDSTAPSVSNLNTTISGEARFQFAAKGSIINVMSGEGANLLISGSCTNKDIIRMLLPEELPDFSEVRVEGHLREAKGDYTLENVKVRASNDLGLAIKADGRMLLAEPMNGPHLKEMDVRFQLSSPTTKPFKPFLTDALPELGPVSISGRVLGSEDQFRFDKLFARTSDGQGFTVELSGSVGVAQKETRKPPGDVDLKIRVTAPNMGAAEPFLGKKYMSELGPIRVEARVTGTTEVLSIEDIKVTVGDSGPVRVEWRGRVGTIPLSSNQFVSDVEILGSIHAKEASALASLAGISVPDLGPLTTTWRLVDRKETLGMDDVKILLGDPDIYQVEATGKVDSVVRRGTFSVDGVNLRVAIRAPGTHGISKLLGHQLPDLGTVDGSFFVSGGLEHLAITEAKLRTSSPHGLEISATGRVGHIGMGADKPFQGIDVELTATAPNITAVPGLAALDLPDLGLLRLKAHVRDRNGNLDVEKFQIRVGGGEEAALLMQGRINRFQTRNQIALGAAFEAATQPWVEKLIQGSMPESHRVSGTVRLTGGTDHFRIEELQISTTDVEGLSLQARGTVEKKARLYEVDAQITSEASDTSVIESILGASLPRFGPPEIKGRLRGNTNEALFEGEIRLGNTHFNTTVSGSLNNQRPRVVAKVSAPTVYLADLGIYPNGSSEEFAPETGSESFRGNRLFDDKPLSFDALKALDVSLSLDAERLIGTNFVLKELDLDLSLDGGRLRISPAKLSYADGFVSIDATVDTAGAKPEITVKIVAEDVDMEAVLAHVHQSMIFGGHLNLAIDMHGVGRSPREIASTLTGEFGVAIEHGKIMRAVDLLGPDALDLLTTVPKIKKYQDLNCLVIRFIFEDGVGNSQIMYLDTPKVRSRGGGSVNLASETIDLVIQPKPKKGLPGTRSAVRIHGPLAKPKVRKLPFREAARLFGEIFAPYVFLPARGLGYLRYLMKKDKDEQSPCLLEAPQVK